MTLLTILAPPFISDDVVHRKEIARWMQEVQPTIDGMASLSVSSTITTLPAMRTYMLVGSGTVSTVVTGLGRHVTFLVNSNTVVFKHGLGMSLNAGLDFTASTGASLSLVNNGTVLVETGRKI